MPPSPNFASNRGNNTRCNLWTSLPKPTDKFLAAMSESTVQISQPIWLANHNKLAVSSCGHILWVHPGLEPGQAEGILLRRLNTRQFLSDTKRPSGPLNKVVTSHWEGSETSDVWRILGLFIRLTSMGLSRALVLTRLISENMYIYRIIFRVWHKVGGGVPD